MTAVLPGWRTPLEEMAGGDLLALRLVQWAEECQHLDHRSKIERVGQAAVLMADRQPNESIAEAHFYGLIDAVHEWHQWDYALDAGLSPSMSREQADENVLWHLAACALGDTPCVTCVHNQPTVHGIKAAELPRSHDCADHRQADRRSLRRLISAIGSRS